MTPRDPVEPSDLPNCSDAEQVDDLATWMRKQVLMELRSVNQKLDKVLTQGVVNEHQVSQQQNPPQTVNAQQGPLTRQVSPKVNANKWNRIRPKVKALGMLAAAGKAEVGNVGSAGSQSFSDEVVTASQRIVSLAPSTRKSDHWRPPGQIWDSDADKRMVLIRKTLQTNKEKQGLASKLWVFTESPYSSKPAFIYAGFTHCVISSSIVSAFLHTSFSGCAWDIMQYVFEALFAVELTVRFICCPHLGVKFVLSFFNLVDLCSVIPLLLRLIIFAEIGSSGKDTLLVIVAMVRLLKLLRRFEKLKLLLHAFELTMEALPALVYTLIFLALAFSGMIYFVEPRENLEDLPTAAYFAIVTMTTVGYGDITPTTQAGHAIACVFMIISGLYMAIPLGIVGNAFKEVWDDRDRILVIKRFRDAFLTGGFSVKVFEEIFAIFDEDDSGSLNLEEFILLLDTIQMQMSEARAEMLFYALDNFGEGAITRECLMNALGLKGTVSHSWSDDLCHNPQNVKHSAQSSAASAKSFASKRSGTL
jgi:hypothetical protein